MLDDAAKAAKAENRTEISGNEAFTLYDTYGFPLDLTMLILKDYGMTVDREGFDREMASQKARARMRRCRGGRRLGGSFRRRGRVRRLRQFRGRSQDTALPPREAERPRILSVILSKTPFCRDGRTGGRQRHAD